MAVTHFVVAVARGTGVELARNLSGSVSGCGRRCVGRIAIALDGCAARACARADNSSHLASCARGTTGHQKKRKTPLFFFSFFFTVLKPLWNAELRTKG
jgi:hypothetical protein